MTTAPTSPHLQDASASRMPLGVRVVIAAVCAVLLGSAGYLWADRGAALLLDLAAMGGKFFCL